MSGKTVKHVLTGVTLIFAGVLAVVIGQRMSTDAMAVVVGIIFGVAASIPTSLIVAMLARKTQARENEERFHRERSQPPVVIVAPGGTANPPWLNPYQQPAYPKGGIVPTSRDFHVVGDQYD